jgi:hypothetical protein
MNIDILTIHLRILNHLEKPEYNEKERQRINDLKNEFLKNNNELLSHNVLKNIQNEVDDKEYEFQQMDDFSLLHFYLLYSIPLIEKYKILLKKPIQISFINNQNINNHKEQNDRKIIIDEYLCFIKKYFQNFEFFKDILLSSPVCLYNLNEKKNGNELKCKYCENTTNFEIFDNQNVCRECGMVIDQFNHQILSFKDIERVNLNSKYTYDRRSHFRDCIYQFQGKQNVTINVNVYNDIIKRLLSHGIIQHNYQQLSKEIAFEKVTKEHIYIFLKDTKYVKHYEDNVLIYHTLTGKKIPDISYLEEDLMNDFDILVEHYDKKYKHSDRKNFINTQYVLYQLLKRHKYPCQKEDFNILKTIDRKYYHDEICSELFSELGWNFQPLF